jgi:hypothetical protein
MDVKIVDKFVLSWFDVFLIGLKFKNFVVLEHPNFFFPGWIDQT